MSRSEVIYSRSPIPVQTILLNLKATELFLERYGPKFKTKYAEFIKNQELNRDGLREYQNQRLRSLIQHAYENVPYYRELMDGKKLKPDDIKKSEDLPKLPVLTRGQVKGNFKKLQSSSYPKLLLRHGHTSGTTGSPLDFFYDINVCVTHLAAVWRQRKWAGMDFTEPIATLQGRVIVPLSQQKAPFWRKNYINNQLFLSSFHLTKENLPYYFDKLEKEHIRSIEGYPSNLYILALYLLKNNQTFPMKTVLTSSETLFEHQRTAIEKAFSCRIYDYYGMAERSVFATECSQHNGRHLNMDYGIAEFLNSEGKSVEYGQLGRIIATSLHNYAMPLIRYQTNDSSILLQEPCPCGCSFPLMEDVTTKQESIITLPDGRLISPSVMTHPFKPMHNIRESQIIQKELDRLFVRLVPDDNYTEDDEKQLRKAFHERLGEQVKLDIEYVNHIPKEKSGKFKWVISYIEPTF